MSDLCGSLILDMWKKNYSAFFAAFFSAFFVTSNMIGVAMKIEA